MDLKQELTNQKGLATSLKNLLVRAFLRQVDSQNKATSEIVESRQKTNEQLGRRIGNYNLLDVFHMDAFVNKMGKCDTTKQ